MGLLQSDLFVKTIVTLMPNNDAERPLDIRRVEHTDHIRKLRKVRREDGLAEIFPAGHALLHVKAGLRWIDLTASQLNELCEDARL